MKGLGCYVCGTFVNSTAPLASVAVFGSCGADPAVDTNPLICHLCPGTFLIGCETNALLCIVGRHHEHQGTRPHCPYWQANNGCLLPGRTYQGHAFRLLGRLFSHCKLTAWNKNWPRLTSRRSQLVLFCVRVRPLCSDTFKGIAPKG